MTNHESATTPDRESQDELLIHAASALRRRYASGRSYHELPPSAAADLGDRLAEIASAPHPAGGHDREEAIALAHRLLDDDHPELSPMWPGATA